MSIKTFLLSLIILLTPTVCKSEILTATNTVEKENCMPVSICIEQPSKIKQNYKTSHLLSSTTDKKTCKNRGETYQEKAMIEIECIKLVCKNGRFVLRHNKDLNQIFKLRFQ